MPDQQGSSEAKLPINSKSRGPAIEGLPGAGRKDRRQKTLTSDGNRPRRAEQSESRAWADYTPTPFQEYGATPWSHAHKMMAHWGHGAFGPGMPPCSGMHPGYMAGVQEPDRPGDAQLPEHPRFAHASPTPGGPTPKVWPSTPTPTPGAQPSMPYGFGVPGMMPGRGLPLQMQMPPNFNMMAEAAREAASAAAMAAAAAGSPDEPQSPSRSPPEEGGSSSGPGAPFHDDYSGDFDSQGLMPPGPFPGQLGPAGLGPSRGSHFHGTGKCRPCAWFHKPQGCQSAQSCSYCHICPEGELKSRKKLKVAAMRMGALTPAKQGKVGHGRDAGAGGAARTLKLNPLL